MILIQKAVNQDSWSWNLLIENESIWNPCKKERFNITAIIKMKDFGSDQLKSIQKYNISFKQAE